MSAQGDEEESSEGVIIAAKSDRASFLLSEFHLGKWARHAVPLPPTGLGLWLAYTFSSGYNRDQIQ